MIMYTLKVSKVEFRKLRIGTEPVSSSNILHPHVLDSKIPLSEMCGILKRVVKGNSGKTVREISQIRVVL